MRSVLAKLQLFIPPLLIGIAWTFFNSPPSNFAFFENAVLRTLLVGILVAFLFGARELKNWIGPRTRPEALLLVCLTAGAAALRWTAPAVPFHSDNWLPLLGARVLHEPEPFFYSNGFVIFIRLFLPFVHSPDQAIFLGNRIAGTLSVPVIYLAARALKKGSKDLTIGSDWALWAALLLALLPIHIRFSSSDSMQVVPILFLLLTVVGFRGHARLGSLPLLAIGICSFTYAALTRPESSGLALALPLLYLSREGRARLLDPWLLGGSLVALLTGGPLFLKGLQRATQENFARALLLPLESKGHFEGAVQIFKSALTAAGWPHGTLVVLGAPGLVLTALEAPASAVFLFLAFAPRMIAASVDDDPGNMLQLLWPQFPWIILAVATLPAMLIRLFRSVAGTPLATGLGAGMAAAAIVCCLRSPFMHLTWDVHEEWTFMQRESPRIQAKYPELPVVRGLQDQASPSLPHYFFPTSGFALVDELLAGQVSLPAIYYRGLDCYRGDGEGYTKGPLREECVDVEHRYRLTPLSTTVVRAPDYRGQPPPAPMEIGFFRLDRRP